MVRPHLDHEEDGQEDGSKGEQTQDLGGRPAVVSRDRERHHKRNQAGDQRGGAREVDVADGSG